MMITFYKCYEKLGAAVAAPVFYWIEKISFCGAKNH